MYKRVLLKLSGEALSDGSEIFCREHLDDVAKQIKEIASLGVQVGIVVGGGNIYRGKIGETLGMERKTGDYIGMLATVMNALALSNSLKQAGVDVVVRSAIEMTNVVKTFKQDEVNEELNNGKVVIFAAGTGRPYFSTDTCCVLRALETNSQIILVAKNGVDGVYSADPKKDANATRYDTITYDEILDKNLQVMDNTAIALARENNMGLFIFNMNVSGNLVKAVKGEITGTKVTK